MGLLDVPPEIFQRVVKALVKKGGIVEAWKLRQTCSQYLYSDLHGILELTRLQRHFEITLTTKSSPRQS